MKAGHRRALQVAVYRRRCAQCNKLGLHVANRFGAVKCMYCGTPLEGLLVVAPHTTVSGFHWVARILEPGQDVARVGNTVLISAAPAKSTHD